MSHRKTDIAVILVVLFTLAFYPVFFRMDFQKSGFIVADWLDMVSPFFPIYLIFICVLLAAYVLTLSKEQTSAFFPVVLMLVFFSLFVVSQFPVLSGKDYFLHGKETNLIVTGGKMVVTNPTSYLQWPGKFIIEAFLRLFTDLDQILLMRILTFLFQLWIIIPYYLMSKKGLGGFLGGLVPALFLLSNIAYTHDTLDHFCPQLLALALYMTAMYIYVKMDKLEQKHVLLLILLGTAITVSHPITAPFFIFSLFGIAIAKKYLTKPKGSIRIAPDLFLVFLMCTIWLAWTIYSANAYITASAEALLNTRMAQTVQQFTPTGFSGIENSSVSLLLTFLSAYWKILALFIVIGAFALILLRRDNSKETVIFFGMLLGNLLYGFVTPLFWTDRIFMFILVPACYLATRFYSRFLGKTIFAIVLVLLIFPSFMTIHAFTFEYWYNVHPWETNTCLFLATHNSGQKLVSSDYGTMIIYSYYDPGSWPGGIVGDEELFNHTLPMSEYPLLKGEFVIRSLRQEITYQDLYNESSHQKSFAYWNSFDTLLNNMTSRDRVFDNSYAQIYAKP